MTSRPAQDSMHDTIDALADEISRVHQSLASRGTRPDPLHHLEPAAAWVAEAVLHGRSVPVNPATALALTGAAVALREAEWHAILRRCQHAATSSVSNNRPAGRH